MYTSSSCTGACDFPQVNARNTDLASFCILKLLFLDICSTFAEPEQGAQVETSSKSDTSALPPVPREEESGNESTTEESEKPALTPEDVATCDKKYWLCVGHNKLKVKRLLF